jgi:hypothetical protein
MKTKSVSDKHHASNINFKRGILFTHTCIWKENTSSYWSHIQQCTAYILLHYYDSVFFIYSWIYFKNKCIHRHKSERSSTCHLSKCLHVSSLSCWHIFSVSIFNNSEWFNVSEITYFYVLPPLFSDIIIISEQWNDHLTYKTTWVMYFLKKFLMSVYDSTLPSSILWRRVHFTWYKLHPNLWNFTKDSTLRNKTGPVYIVASLCFQSNVCMFLKLAWKSVTAFSGTAFDFIWVWRFGYGSEGVDPYDIVTVEQ